jgi:hypothetical protein
MAAKVPINSISHTNLEVILMLIKKGDLFVDEGLG